MSSLDSLTKGLSAGLSSASSGLSSGFSKARSWWGGSSSSRSDISENSGSYQGEWTDIQPCSNPNDDWEDVGYSESEPPAPGYNADEWERVDTPPSDDKDFSIMVPHYDQSPQGLKNRTWEDSLTDPTAHKVDNFRYLVCSFIDPLDHTPMRLEGKGQLGFSAEYVTCLGDPNLLRQGQVLACQLISNRHCDTTGAAGFILKSDWENILGVTTDETLAPPETPTPGENKSCSLRDYLETCMMHQPIHIWVAGNHVFATGIWIKRYWDQEPLISPDSVRLLHAYANYYRIPVIYIQQPHVGRHEQKKPFPPPVISYDEDELVRSVELRRGGYRFRLDGTESEVIDRKGNSFSMTMEEQQVLISQLALAADGRRGVCLQETPSGEKVTDLEKDCLRTFIVQTHRIHGKVDQDTSRGAPVPRCSHPEDLLFEMAESQIASNALLHCDEEQSYLNLPPRPSSPGLDELSFLEDSGGETDEEYAARVFAGVHPSGWFQGILPRF